MEKMPEVYDDYNEVKSQINQSDQLILYVTPEVARWMVDEDYQMTLREGQAVKISKWEDNIKVIPVKWERMPETSQWNWREIGRPYTRNISTNELP